jgi:hypothetical protein
MSEITIQILNTIGECSNYQSAKGAAKQKVDIVISPLKIQNTDDKIKVTTGCNMFEGCYNPTCYFSSAARTKNGKQ